DRKGVTYRGTAGAPVRIVLDSPSERVTSAAVRPPSPNRPGLIAVAFTDDDASRSVIVLCDLEGRHIRHLDGHLHPVRSLTFSESRPLLVSVGDDHMVCVWSLAEVDPGIGEIPGLGVTESGARVVVGHVKQGSPAHQAGLARGDVI